MSAKEMFEELGYKKSTELDSDDEIKTWGDTFKKIFYGK